MKRKVPLALIHEIGSRIHTGSLEDGSEPAITPEKIGALSEGTHGLS